MKMKQWIGLILALVILTSMTALAAPEDRNFIRKGSVFEELSDDPRGGCVVGDTLYLYGYSHIYTCRVGDDGFAVAEFSLPDAGENESRELVRLFADGDALRALVSVFRYDEGSYGPVRLELMKVEIDGGEARFGETVEADVKDLTVSYGDESSLGLVQMGEAISAGGFLFLRVSTDAGEQRVYALRLDSGEGSFLDAENVRSIAAWKEDQLLIETFDYGEKMCRFLLCDPGSGNLTAACDPVWLEQPLYGLAYSAETDRLFYLKDGYVIATANFDFESPTPVAELFIRYAEESAGMLLPGDCYVCCSAYDGVSIRSTAPGALAQTRLTVQSAGVNRVMMNTYYDFSAAHSDVAVVLREDYAEDASIAQAMMNRDTSVDIYTLSVNTEAFDALYDRGYMAALDDARIVEAVAGMYPAIQEALKRDGEIVAVPAMIYGWTLGLDYEGFEKIGIPREDVPDNWPDFLDLLSELPERLPEDGSVRIFPDYYTQHQARVELLSGILDSWHLWLDATGKEISYDSPELRAALEKVMALDLEGMGLSKGDEDDQYVMISVVGGGWDRTYTLVEPSAGCTIGNFSYAAEPALLSVIPGETQPVPLGMAVAFVNPYSENLDLAQEFLTAILENLDEDALYNLSDRLNEPVRNRYYQENMEHAQAELEGFREKLAAADPKDVPLWEERIADTETVIGLIEENGWEIAPEHIAWYRDHDEDLFVSRYHYIDVRYSSGEFTDLVQQFMAGRASAEEFLRELDRRVRMKAREGN